MITKESIRDLVLPGALEISARDGAKIAEQIAAGAMGVIKEGGDWKAYVTEKLRGNI